MSGYTGIPLPKKLGIKPDHRVRLLGVPPGPPDLGVDGDEGPGPYDVILLFCRDREALRDGFAPAADALARDGGLWVCRPKKASKVATDLSDGVVREFGLAQGMVDNKVCAVDAVWSGLRFVYRLGDR
ncbi:DUF3052 domain-containing protein [Planotetraspora thailandica]|uniref:DUF3052 domain-containing protein n=1 Tax=Planotetraspora thailandica TaxID=487172 RepID=A0A8J3V976_9ACTN|nr:DUF3052 family protein [Planotetraspora thailandica]GII57226.1 DUF3052 domain-containing protein [Planotetraspora thailandica]